MAAGCAHARYRDLRLDRYVPLALLLAVVVGPSVVFGHRFVAMRRQPAAALTPAWSEFQADCVAGASPGQGFAPRACVCWERNLEAVNIYPSAAVQVLTAARAGGESLRQISGESVGDAALRDAMGGCGL